MAEYQKQTANTPLSANKEWFYGAGTFSMTMCLSITNTYFYYFLTDIVGMNPILMGLVTTVSQTATLLFAPVRGILIMKKEFKSGKYNTWARWFFPLSIVFYSLTFFNFQASDIVQFLYYSLVYMLATVINEFCEVAMLSAMPLVAKTPEQLVRISSKRSVIATLGTVIYSLVTAKLVEILSFGDLGSGYLYCYMLYGAIGIIGYKISADIIKPYDLYPVANSQKSNIEKEKLGLMSCIRAYTKNSAALLSLTCGILKAAASLLYSGAINYYLVYYAESAETLSLFLFISNITMLLGSWLCIPLCNRLGKKTVEILAYGGFALGLIGGRFIGVGHAWGICACIGFGRFCSGLDASLLGAVYADIADYYEYKSGINMRSFYLSVASCAFLIARIFVGSVVGVSLANAGYYYGAHITPQIKTTMLNLVTIIPGIPLMIGALLFLLYPLTEKKMQNVRAALGRAIESENK